MTTILASHALLADGRRPNVRIDIAAGAITAVTHADGPRPGDAHASYLLPGIPNLHSHAFRRAMAGRAEHRDDSPDRFWTFRLGRYRCALAVNPDDIEAIAAYAYMEMLKRGFTRVGEIHYLHHAPDGIPYADVGEMSIRIAAAAAVTGIRLTLLQSFYSHATFSVASPHAGQRRFICDPDPLVRFFERTIEATVSLPGAGAGLAPPQPERCDSRRACVCSRNRCDLPGPHSRRQTGSGGRRLPGKVRSPPGRPAPRAPARIGPGSPVDLVSLTPAPWTPAAGDAVLDAGIVADEARVADVLVAGERLVADGVHREHVRITRRIRDAMRRRAGE